MIDANTIGVKEESTRQVIQDLIRKIDPVLANTEVLGPCPAANEEAAKSTDWHFEVLLEGRDAAKMWHNQASNIYRKQIKMGKNQYILGKPDFCRMCHGNGHLEAECGYSSKQFLETYGYNINIKASSKKRVWDNTNE